MEEYVHQKGITAGFSQRDQPFYMKNNHFHVAAEIYLLLECQGSGEITIDEKTCQLTTGALVLLDSQQVHRTNFLDSPAHKRIMIEINTFTFEGMIQEIAGISLTRLFSDYAGVYQLTDDFFSKLGSKLLNIYTEVKEGGEYSTKLTPLMLAEVCLLLMRYFEEKRLSSGVHNQLEKPMNPLITEAIAFIDGHLSSELSLEQISEMLFVNKSYLSRLFKKETGFSLHEYINIRRVRYAKDLLPDLRLSIESVGKLSGYANLTYFERVFKKYTETTPSSFRIMLCENQKMTRSFNHNDNRDFAEKTI